MPARRTLLAALASGTFAAGFGARPGRAADAEPPLPPSDQFLEMASGVHFYDIKRGTGPEPKTGQKLTMTYTGWLFNGDKRGKQFDSSADHGGSFSFTLGQGEVIKGWDDGVATMHVGGERWLIIPSRLGYGEQGAGDAIPSNSTLLFLVGLLGIQ